MKFYTFWFAHFVESERKRDSWELKFLNISNRGWFNRIFRCCRSQFGRNSEITPAFDHCYAHTFFSSPPPCPVVCGWTRAQQRCFSPPPPFLPCKEEQRSSIQSSVASVLSGGLGARVSASHGGTKRLTSGGGNATTETRVCDTCRLSYTLFLFKESFLLNAGVLLRKRRITSYEILSTFLLIRDH